MHDADSMRMREIATRRAFLRAAVAASAAVAFATDVRAQVSGRPTPACGDSGGPTPRQTEGPYYTPRTPMRASLIETGMGGTRLVVEGVVLSAACTPIPKAILDFWQADDRGEYDNSGYRLRGHQIADERGRYRLITIVPGNYPGRTRHIHVKVAAPGRPPLTTQLYFPDEPNNSRDGIFVPELVMKVRDRPQEGKVGAFDFVLDVRSS